MSNKRINELTNIFDIQESELDESYLVVDNKSNGTSKYDFQSLFAQMDFKYSQTDLIERIEKLEKRITSMNAELPLQIIDLDAEKYYNQLDFEVPAVSCFDQTTKRFRIGAGTDEESGDPSKIVMRFNHESTVGVMIDYIGTKSETGKQYYFDIVETNSSGNDTSEHVIDRVTSMDAVAHSYQRWLKVYNGSQIYVDIYDSVVSTSTVKVSSVFPLFKVHVFMYSNSPLAGWSTKETKYVIDNRKMCKPFTLDTTNTLLVNGYMRSAGKDSAIVGDYIVTSWNTSWKFSYFLNAINEYKESTTTAGTYTNTVANKLNIKIMPTVQYASAPEEIDSTLTSSYTYAPSTTNDKAGTAKQKVLRNGQVYMLPSEVKDIPMSEIGLPNSGKRFRFTSQYYSDFFNGVGTSESVAAPTVLPYEQTLYNFLTEATPTYAAVAKVNSDGKTVTPLSEDKLISTAKTYYDFEPIDGQSGTKYVVVYGYRTAGLNTSSNTISFNVKVSGTAT